MSTHTAAVLEGPGEAFTVKTVPVPTATPDSAVIKVLATSISPGAKGVFSGKVPAPLRTPVTPYAASIGRVHAVGSDASSLKEGQLVLTDLWIRSRDDPDNSILAGYMGGNDTLEAHWDAGTYAEYARVPLERTWALDETKLCKDLGYTPADLVYLGTLLIPLAGMLDIDVRPGDSVIVAPATGYFGGSAVQAALALGASVIACGRNHYTLEQMSKTFESAYPGRLSVVELTANVEADTKFIRAAAGGKGAHKYVDFSPPQSAGSKHMVSCLSAMRPHGKCVVMGAVFGEIGLPYWLLMRQQLSIQGRYMFERWHVEQGMKLLETSQLKLGNKEGNGMQVKSFKLQDVQKALEQAEQDAGWGRMTVLEPWRE